MPKTLLKTLRGIITLALQVTNTVFWGVPLYVMTIGKALSPPGRWRRACNRALVIITQGWVDGVLGILAHTRQRTRWEIHRANGLKQTKSYLLISNHQSWVDIIAIFQTINRRTPFPRFFAKRELLWLPIVGQALWALDFPLLKRHSAEAVSRNPELRREDQEITRKACERYRQVPVTLINFLEGTRFTAHKHRQRASPHTHLLPPKIGGFALALDSMDGEIDTVVDVTIAYPGGAPNFWEFLCGRVERVVVETVARPIPEHLLKVRFRDDAAARADLRAWLDDLWREKDQRLENVL